MFSSEREIQTFCELKPIVSLFYLVENICVLDFPSEADAETCTLDTCLTDHHCLNKHYTMTQLENWKLCFYKYSFHLIFCVSMILTTREPHVPIWPLPCITNISSSNIEQTFLLLLTISVSIYTMASMRKLCSFAALVHKKI